VRAQCPTTGIAGGLTARLDPSLLPALEALLPGLLPASIAIPAESYTAFECSGDFDDTILTPREAVAAIDVTDLHLSLADGSIGVEATADVDVTGKLDMQVCALPDAVCDARLVASGVTLRGRVEARLDACQPVFSATDVVLDAAPDRTSITLGDCAYDELWDVAAVWFEEALLGLLTEELSEVVQDELPPALEAFTTELVAEGLDASGVRFLAAPERLEVAPAGVTLSFTADVLPNGPPAPCLDPATTLPPEAAGRAPAPTSTAPISLAVSHPLVQRAVRAAWLAGGLCWNSRELDLDLATPLEVFAPDVSVFGQVVPEQPPSVAWGDATRGEHLRVHAKAVRVDVDVQVPGHRASTMTARLDLAVAAEVAIDPGVQALVVRPRSVTSSGALVTAPGATLGFGEETLRSLVDGALLPALGPTLERLPLLTNLLVAAPVAVRVDAVRVRDDSLEADLELWPRDVVDDSPPETLVSAPPPALIAEDVDIGLGSWDDRTPDRFMRHQVALDGVFDDSLVTGSIVRLDGLDHGAHSVQLAAVDLAGNMDPTPETVAFFVDASPPVVTLEDAPRGVVRGDEATLTIRATDDTTLADRLLRGWTLGSLGEPGEPDRLIDSGVLQGDGGLTLAGLPEDTVLRFTAWASDEAGNRGEASMAFFANASPDLGCATSSAIRAPLVLRLLLRRTP